jgi:hypothetical protein
VEDRPSRRGTCDPVQLAARDDARRVHVDEEIDRPLPDDLQELARSTGGRCCGRSATCSCSSAHSIRMGVPRARRAGPVGAAAARPARPSFPTPRPRANPRVQLSLRRGNSFRGSRLVGVIAAIRAANAVGVGVPASCCSES